MVTITGTGFTNAAAVEFDLFGGSEFAAFTVNSDTSITATVPPTATSGVVLVHGAQSQSGPYNVTFTVLGISPPTITSFNPVSGGAGTTVTITGTSFTGATGVTIGGASDGAYTVNSDTQITVTVPADVATGPITVTNPNGSATSSQNFTIIPAPAITDVEPSSGMPGDEVILVGTGFTNASSVAFNGTSAPDYLIVSDEYIIVYVPAGATTGPITVVTPGGTATSGNFTVMAPAPTISGVSPASGADGTTILITGSGFSYVTSVTFNGTTANIAIDSDGRIRATVPVGATTGPITVTSPGGTASSGIFTVIPAPTITSISPAHGIIGVTVTINGAYLDGATSVTFNGTSATIATDTATQITTTVPAGATSGPVVVTTPGGTASATFTVVAPSMITSISPTSGLPGSTVAIHGVGFTDTSAVDFNGVSASFHVFSDGYVSAVVPIGATTGSITVTSPGGTATSPTFTVIAPLPTISSLSPTTGPEGTSVVITGTGFTYATAVDFNGLAATFVVNNDGQITATVPTGATTGTVSVTSPGGTATSVMTFTIPAPTVAVAASASPSPVTSTTASLSVLGAYAGGESALTYTWSSTGPAGVTFSATGTNAAKNSTATFTQAGSYTLTVTIASPSGYTAQSSVPVVVNQTPTITVLPNPAILIVGSTLTLIASVQDQFGNGVPGAVVWSETGVGIVDAGGNYTAGGTPGAATVTATAAGTSGSTRVIVDDVPPTLGSITVNPNPVTATTATLAVTGNYAGGGTLTYQWQTLASPPGGSATFAGGTGGAAGSPVTATATFTEAGSYTVQVTVTDDNNRTATQSVTFTVSQTGTAVVVTPSTTSVALTGTQTFTAQENDQFGNAMAPQPTFAWSSAGDGGIDAASGLYTAGSAPGTATITATPSDGIPAGTASATVTNTPPSVATVAKADGISIIASTAGTSVALTVLGAYAGGESSLTYAWSASPSTGVTFSATGTNAAKSVTATFTQAGSYTFTATITDPTGAQVSSAVTVLVNQLLTSVTVSPNPDTESIGVGTRQFGATGFDQFGNALGTAPPFTWSNTGVGSVGSGTGIYTPGGTPGSATVTAAFGSVSGSASVTVADVAPTLGTITVNPNPVTGTTPTLTVTGSYTGTGSLTYAWTSLSTPSGATITFSGGTSGTPGSPVTTNATLTLPGSYTVGVTVTDAAGTMATQTVTFTVIPPPTIISFSPTSALTGAPVLIAGTGFLGTTSVSFNGTVASQFTVVSDTYVYVHVPAGATTGPISLTTPNGTAISGTNFTIIPPPTITSFSPGSALPGSPVAVHGTGLTGATAVTFDGVAATQFTVVSDTYIYVTVPTGATSGTITVTTPNGTATSPGIFSVIAPMPAITSFSPISGPEGTLVVITGSGLTYATSVLFNGISATFIANNDGQITATAPTGGTTGMITVTSPGGTATSVGVFTYSAPTVATVAAATPSPVTGTTASLSVLGAYAGGESALTYTWSSTGPAGVTFSATGTNAAKNSTATFTQAGSYTLTVTIASPSSYTATSSVTVVVNQTPATVTVSPSSQTINVAGTQPFSASVTDQFGNGISGAVFTWSKTGVGSVNAAGLFSAGGTPGLATVTAATAGVFGSATVTVNDVAPTLGSITVNPNPVTATTATLAVTGNYAGGGTLTYQWQTLASPPGGSATFAGGTSGAAGSPVTATATFTEAGSYTVQVTVTDDNAGTATQTATFTVSQTGTAVVVTPSTTSVALTGTQTFTAQENDQFGNAMAPQPTFAWSSAGDGGIDAASGLYTAGSAPGTATITATPSDGVPAGTASATVTNTPPSVATVAKANGTPVSTTTTGTSVALTVLGAYAGGESSLTYAWSASPSTGVTFSATGTNAAKSVTATFTQAGSYTFTATITDPTSASVSSSVVVLVTQALTSVTVSPNPDTESIGVGTQQFGATGFDQFGNALGTAPPFTWSNTGVGSVGSGTGIYTPGGTPGSATVTAASGSVSGSASVTVADIAPTLSAITVNPNPVMGTSGTLSVTGFYTGTGNLTYAWTTTATPIGGSATFTGGTSGANGGYVTTNATFSQPGSYTVKVTGTDAAGTTATQSVTFTVIGSPTISSFTPSSGPVGRAVTITGTYFTGASSVTFGGVAATSFLVNSSTQITATVPAGAATGVITVTTPGGTTTSAGSFTVIPNPVITSFSPVSGPVGTSVTITGIGFTNASSVTFGGTPAVTFTVTSDTSITATVPAGAATGVITVTTGGGTATSSSAFTVIPAPAITSFSPGNGPVGTSVTITGSGFTNASSVTFGGTAAVTFTVTSDTSITATVPSGATTGVITVTTPGGTVASASSFTVIPAPAITSFTATSGPVGTIVTITGTGLTGATTVTFGGTAAVAFTVVSDTSITATVPTGATTGVIIVTTPGGTAASSATFTVIPAPAITGFTPATGPAGTSVTITGTGLTGATSVTFGASSAAFTVVSATQITTTVPAGATTGVITVITPGGTATSANPFTVIPIPSVVSFTPASGPAGTSVTIIGSGLTGATAVTFNGSMATFTVISGTSITAIVPAGATTGTITVTTPGGVATSANSFTVIPVPAITSFSPMSGPVGTSVTITGTGLTGATVVKFGGTAAVAYTVVSDTSITATVPTGAATGVITVTTGGGTATSASAFTVIPAPTIISFSPASGLVGTSVTITGTNLTGATSVKFNGTVAAFTVASGTSITATVPTGATTGVITVVTPGGSVSSAATFTVLTAPAITTVSPASGIVGDTITITGTGLTGATSVKFNGTTAAFTVVSGTSITATVPTGATTGVITVTTPGGTAASASSFTVLTWNAVDVAADPDGTAKVLDVRSDNAANVLLFSGSDTLMTNGPVFGPFTDSQGTWTAKSIKTAADGSSRILWSRTDGAAGLWLLNANGSVAAIGTVYGPYSDSHGTWSATGLASASDGTARVLWTRTDGGAAVWNFTADGTATSEGAVYGPYGTGQSAWHATGIAGGSNGTAHLLWTRADGAAGLWTMSATDTQLTVGPTYGPFTTAQGLWRAMSIGSSTDGTSHVLWMRADGAAGLWAFTAADAGTADGPVYGPFAGFSPKAMDTYADQSRVLWVETNRAFGLWTFNASDTETLIGSTYGPF